MGDKSRSAVDLRAYCRSTSTGPQVLLTGYQAPAAIRRMGAGRLEAWLRARHVRGAAGLAGAACAAAARQHIALAGEALTASLIADLAKEAISLSGRLREIGKLIEDRWLAMSGVTIR